MAFFCSGSSDWPWFEGVIGHEMPPWLKDTLYGVSSLTLKSARSVTSCEKSRSPKHESSCTPVRPL